MTDAKVLVGIKTFWYMVTYLRIIFTSGLLVSDKRVIKSIMALTTYSFGTCHTALYFSFNYVSISSLYPPWQLESNPYIEKVLE